MANIVTKMTDGGGLGLKKKMLEENVTTQPVTVAPKVVNVQPAQSDFDAQEYIKALNEARLQEQMAAFDAAQTRALTGLDTTYNQKKNSLNTAKTNNLTSLENALNEQLSNLQTMKNERGTALDTGLQNYLTNLENSLQAQLLELENMKTGRQTALDTAKNNYQASLDNALNKAMSNLANEEAKIDPYYYDARNQVAAASDVGAMNFAQYMAGRGIKGAAAGMPQIYQNAAMQGQIGALNRQEAANKAEIERARTDTQNEYQSNKAAMERNYEADLAALMRDYENNQLSMQTQYDTSKTGVMNNYQADMAALETDFANKKAALQNQYQTGKAGTLTNYQNDLAALESEYLSNKQGIEQAYEQDRLSAQAGINAQGLQAYIDQLNADRLFSLNEARITGRYGGQPTLEAQLAEADLTGYYKGLPTFNTQLAEADLTGYYQGTPTLKGQEFQQNLQDSAKQSWLDTIGRFSDNYQAEINRVQGDNDTTNDWQIPYLQAARQDKLRQQAEQAATQAAAASAQERQRYKDALELWKQYGTATAEIASVLGVPEGARTAEYDIDKLNAMVAQQNADTAAQKANQQNETEYNYKSDPDFASDIAYINSNPATALSEIQSMAEQLIEKYGYDGYQALLAQARAIAD